MKTPCGFKIGQALNATMPEKYRNADGWYEEDCEAYKVVLAFPELFNAEQVMTAKSGFNYWFKDAGGK